jgi:hypothetical protein
VQTRFHLRTVSKHTHECAHLGQHPGRLVLDDPEHPQRPLGVGSRDGLPGLSLDDDAGEVVGHGVVQLACQMAASRSSAPPG